MFKNKNKLFIPSAVLIVLFLGVVGFVYVGLLRIKQDAEKRPGEEYGVEYRQPGEIEITDIGNNQKRVTDKRQGYLVTIPADWKIEPSDTLTASTKFYNHTSGCKITVNYFESKRSLNDFINDVETKDLRDLTLLQFRVSEETFGDLVAKHVFVETKENGYAEIIYVQKDNKIFNSILYVIGGDRSTCTNLFSTFLTSVSTTI